ncbi:hypothetical protein BaRGS_00035189, partial [Batillaria attramentaria]
LGLLVTVVLLLLAQPASCDRERDDQKVTYTVEVLTADIRGAGTNASVQVILKDAQGNKTPPILLNNFFRNDFERGQLDIFELRECDTKNLRGKLDVLILERDETGFANDWYVDHVTVQKRKSNKEYVFPFNRWVLANTRYRIPHLDTSLPADDPFPEQRQAFLQNARRVYKISEDPTQPAGVQTLPVDEEWSDEYMAFTSGTLAQATITNLNSPCSPEPWTSLDQLDCLFTEPNGSYPRPDSIDTWRDDEWFGSQRLAGVDPTILRLSPEIPDNLAVTEEDLLPFLEGHSLGDVIAENRLYVCDLHYLQNYSTGAYGKVLTAPIALFYANDNKQLMPIAIQLFQQPGADNPVFFPSDDPYTWLLAKMWYNLAEGNHHQAVSHLYLTHLAIESFSLATHRELSGSHPIFRLLKPHFMFMLHVNARARATFFGPTGIFSVLLNIGGDNVLQLGAERLWKWRVNVEGTLPKALEDRGVLDKNVLPDFPYRDDGLRIYNAVKRYVENYVSLYYDDDKVVLADTEIQSWAEQLTTPRDQGGYGIQGMPLTEGKLASRDDLVLVATCVIFTSSAQHAAVNFPQYDQFSFIPNYPALLLGQPPKDKSARDESDIVQLMPVRDLFLAHLRIVVFLSQRAQQPLGTPLGSFIVDPAAVRLGERFQRDLRNIERDLEAGNELRDPQYDYLYPSLIPNSIGI